MKYDFACTMCTYLRGAVPGYDLNLPALSPVSYCPPPPHLQSSTSVCFPFLTPSPPSGFLLLYIQYSTYINVQCIFKGNRH